MVFTSTASAFLSIRSRHQPHHFNNNFAIPWLKIDISTPRQAARPPFELQHIDHVVIRCKNFDPMLDFYHRILGCTIDEPTSKYLNRFGGALTHLRAGSCYIDLIAYDIEHLSNDGIDAVTKMHAGGQGTQSLNDINFSSDTSTMDHLCLRVEPFNENDMMDYLTNENVEIVVSGGDRLGADGIGRSIYIRDPEGNVIELKGPPHKSNRQGNRNLVEQQSLSDHSGKKNDAKITKKVPDSVQPQNIVTDETLNSNVQAPTTPCIRICRYNSSFHDGQVCIGCYREAYEIKSWQSMTSIEKAMTLLDAIDRCDESEGRFEGAISKDELIQQYQYWEKMAKSAQ